MEYIPGTLPESEHKSEILPEEVEFIMDVSENDSKNLIISLVKRFLVLRIKLNHFISKSIPVHSVGFPSSTWLYSRYEINMYYKKKTFTIAKSPCSFDTNPLTSEITKNKEITLDFSDINSENLSSDNNTSSQEKTSLTKYQKNLSLIKYQNAVDVSEPYGHLWTYYENYERSIYK
jgi:hypothetical protein